MAPDSMSLLQGTLDVLILRSLAGEPKHGYAISRWVRDRTRGTLDIEDAPLYKTLRRLEHAGCVKGRRPPSPRPACSRWPRGIGATTAIFSLVYGVLVRPLPFFDPARLYAVYAANVGAGSLRTTVSAVDVDGWRAARRDIHELPACDAHRFAGGVERGHARLGGQSVPASPERPGRRRGGRRRGPRRRRRPTTATSTRATSPRSRPTRSTSSWGSTWCRRRWRSESGATPARRSRGSPA
jgi:hypothetical protein